MVDTVRRKQSHALPAFFVLCTVLLGCSWNESFTSVGAECVEFCKLLWQTIKKEEVVIRDPNSELATQKHRGSN